MTLTYITKLPEVSTSALRELQWSIDWWGKQYAEAGYQSQIAWEMYSNAIDDQEPQTQIEQLFVVATMFDGIKSDTWRKWQDAKMQYLAIQN